MSAPAKKLDPTLSAALAVHELAKERADLYLERQRLAMAAQSIALVGTMHDAARVMRENLFLLKTMLDAGAGVDVDTEAICAEFIELGAIAYTLPTMGRSRDAHYIGMRCLLCDALIVDVEHPRGRGELAVLVCSNGHRAMQPADGEDIEETFGSTAVP